MFKDMATVYIVDDDASFRQSLERLLRTRGYTTLAFESAATFLAQSSITHPACLLLDVDLPEMDGISLQEKLITQGSTLPIIFITGRGTISMTVNAMKAGAVDFITKPFAKESLFKAIEVALEKDIQAIDSEIKKQKLQSLVDTLTPREREILRWVIAGKPNKEIAYALGISEKTIKIHRGHMMMKLKVSSVAELVRFAYMAQVAPVESVAV